MASIRRSPLVACVCALALVGAMLTTAANEAAAGPNVVTVNSTGNGSDASPGNSTCTTGGTNSAGVPECTLRAAIQEANASATIDTIEFAIPATDSGYEASPVAFRIRPSGSVLPAITNPVILDASTQPEFLAQGRPVVVVDGALAPTSGDPNGLTLQAANSTVRALVVQRFGDDGIEIEIGGGNTIAGNYFGTDVTGTQARPNGTNGIAPVAGISIKSDGNVIGGSSATDRNVTSGNNGFGIVLRSGASNNSIEGNFIGTDWLGTSPIGNVNAGVAVQNAGTGNAIGGPLTNQANRIAFNSGPGVQIVGGRLNSVLGNSISGNGGVGIDLGAVGVLANDSGDGDSGSNDLLNYPVIATAVDLAGTVTVDFDLDVPAGSYRIEAFTNPSGDDPSGFGEGEVFEAAATISHPGGGSMPFQISFSGPSGSSVTLSATGPSSGPIPGSTSEFSRTATITSNVVTVNSTGDLGDASAGNNVCDTGGTVGTEPECTLRAAITEANAPGIVDTIRFAIPGTDPGHSVGLWTIAPASALPNIDQTVLIDGSTQTGFVTNPVIELDGSATVAGVDGLLINGDDVQIRSLAINRFGADGIEVQATATKAVIVGNYIGVSADGMSPQANGERGIDLVAGSGPTTIGGTTPGDRNLVSGNADDGITIVGTNDNVVIGNYIGTDVTGNAPIPNVSDGIWVEDGSTGTRIGQPGSGNVISGNGDDGIEIDRVSGGTIIEANTIGLGSNGDAVVPNGRHGLVLFDGANTTRIGGPWAGNVISGNARHGVHINANSNAATTGNSIEGNLIGTDSTGMLDRGNGWSGIELEGNVRATTIGGLLPASGNVISANASRGIWVSWADGVEIMNNTIGLALDADTSRGNGSEGIRIDSGTNVTIGAAGAGNTISSNVSAGVMTTGADVLIEGNRIGTDGTGLLNRGNIGNGILGGGDRLVIGGIGVDAGNIIGGNTNDGIQLSGGVLDARVEGNSIGIGSDGTTPLGNSARGISMFGSSDIVIGGDIADAGNEIANNTFQAVVANASSDRVSLLGNSIHDNGGLGFDLQLDGVTPNDSFDADSGPNGLLNYPVITSATLSGGIVTVSGTYDVPAGRYRLEFFVNPSGADATGYGEGETFVSAVTLTHPGSGAEPFGAAFAGLEADVVTATITEVSVGPIYGPTSEFALATTVAASGLALDSSVRRSDLAARGGLDLATPVVGVAGSGVGLGGGAERLVGAATDLLSNELTMSAWVRLGAAGSDPRVVAKAASDGSASYEIFVDDATSEAVARVNLSGSTIEVRGGAIGLGTWSQVAATWDGSIVRLYVNGVEVDSVAGSGTLATNVSVPLVVGNLVAADRGLDGQIDQVQVSHVSRSPEWIATAHANVQDPVGSIAMGGAQTSAPTAWTVFGSFGRTGSHSLAAPQTLVGADAWVTAIGVDEPGVEVSSWWRISDPAVVEVATGVRTGAVPTDQNEAALTGAGFDLATLLGGTRTQDGAAPGSIPAGTWVQVVMRSDELGVSTVVVDGVQRIGPTLHSAGAPSGSVGFRAGLVPAGQNWFIDDARVRRLVSVEPWTSLGPLDRN